MAKEQDSREFTNARDSKFKAIWSKAKGVLTAAAIVLAIAFFGYIYAVMLGGAYGH